MEEMSRERWKEAEKREGGDDSERENNERMLNIHFITFDIRTRMKIFWRIMWILSTTTVPAFKFRHDYYPFLSLLHSLTTSLRFYLKFYIKLYISGFLLVAVLVLPFHLSISLTQLLILFLFLVTWTTLLIACLSACALLEGSEEDISGRYLLRPTIVFT